MLPGKGWLKILIVILALVAISLLVAISFLVAVSFFLPFLPFNYPNYRGHPPLVLNSISPDAYDKVEVCPGLEGLHTIIETAGN
jgi:hypothetical protein